MGVCHGEKSRVPDFSDWSCMTEIHIVYICTYACAHIITKILKKRDHEFER